MRNIDIIIPVYNCWVHTQACINSIIHKEYTGDTAYQIILVDNGSYDHTASVSTGTHRNYWLFRAPEPLGYGGAINHYWRTDGRQFAEEMHTTHVLLLNNDTLIHTDDWLDILIDDMEACGGDVVGLGHTYSDPTGEPPEVLPVYSYIGGWALLATVDAWNTVGLFDEQFGVGFYEDKDWCFRAQNLEYNLVHSHRVDIEHLNNTTFDAHPDIDKEKMGRENHNKFLRKWSFYNTPGDALDHGYNNVDGKREYFFKEGEKNASH